VCELWIPRLSYGVESSLTHTETHQNESPASPGDAASRPIAAPITEVSTDSSNERRNRERSVLRRPTSETTNSLSVSDRVRSILGSFSGGGRGVLETPWFESESQLVS